MSQSIFRKVKNLLEELSDDFASYKADDHCCMNLRHL